MTNIDEILDYVIENHEPKDYDKAIRAYLYMGEAGKQASEIGEGWATYLRYFIENVKFD